MSPALIALLLQLAPVVEKLVIDGVELFIRKDMTTEEIIAALEQSKAGLVPMVPKE